MRAMSTGRAPMCFSKVAQSPPSDTHTQTLSTSALLCGVSYTEVLHEHSHPPQRLFLTLNILHNHAKMPPCLKRAEHADNKRVLCKCQDVSFHKGLLDLVSQDQVLLVDLLHGKSLTGLLMPHQKHSPKWRKVCITTKLIIV